ncbi:shikimate kinase [Candidatus Neomarinimicrobiota bacterium]
MKASEDTRPSIFLIGMMGSGKSTVGPSLADQLGFTYVDLDREIATLLGRSITMVFEQQGETTFRREEARCLAYFAQYTGQVIDCGGGIVLDEDNRALLKTNNTIFLNASIDTLVTRLANVSNRPVLNLDLSLEQQITELVVERMPLYMQCSRQQIETDKLTPEGVVAEICKFIVPGELG